MINEKHDIKQIEEIIIAFANGDFTRKVEMSGKFEFRDTLAAWINLLGEELEDTTVNRDYFSNIYNAVSDILIVTDNKGIIKDVNAAIQIATGFNKEELLGKDYRHFIPKGKKLNSGNIESINFETVFQNENGTNLHIDCSISPIIDRFDKHDGYLIIAKDITDKKKKKEQELKLMISTQEKERKRFATDMHDSLGQELNAINLSLSTLDHIGKESTQYDDIFHKCRYMAGHSIGTLKKIAFDLMPKSLEDGNLSLALQELAVSLSELYEINYHFEEKETCLENYVKVIIYRIFQEFISNSMQHANSNSINLLMKNNDGKLLFILSDDGIGFNKSTVKQGSGLKNIESRLEAIKVPYTFSSEEHKGTTLKFEIQV